MNKIKILPSKTLIVRVRYFVAFTNKRLLIAGSLSVIIVMVCVWVGISALVGRPVAPSVITDLLPHSLGGTGNSSPNTTKQSDASNQGSSAAKTTGVKQSASESNNSSQGGTSSNNSPGSSDSGGSPNNNEDPDNNVSDPTIDAIKTLLSNNVTGSLHEAIPHGVPTNYEQRTKAVLKNPVAPNGEMTYINIRGAVYVDESNYRAPNTRVEIMNCRSYGLKQSSNTWEKMIDASPGKLAGRGWREDFTTPGDLMYTNIRTEASGSKSVITFDGYNLHFFNNTNLVPLFYAGSIYSEFVTSCSARLILEDPAGPDNRSSAAYIIVVGNDWKKSDNTCTKNSSGATLCYSLGAGRYIRATNNWRRAVFSSLDTNDLNTKPLPPEEAFINPDGSFGN